MSYELAARSKRIQPYLVELMKSENAYWYHDGNPQRPNAELTGGKISNFYADCTSVVSKPPNLVRASADLLELESALTPLLDCGTPDAYCGSAYGAITLALELTRQSGAMQSWYTAKGTSRGEMNLDRFNFSPQIQSVALCEDVITEFTTTRGTLRAIERKKLETGVKGRILPYILCIVNRSGRTEFEGHAIISLIAEHNAKNWTLGNNPFIPQGTELVPPVRPKQNWDALTRKY